jgi:hypothetical protein
VLFRKLVVAILAAASIALLAPAAALGQFGFTNLSAEPDIKQGGAVSDLRINMEFTDPADQVKDLTIHLPPGQVGNPTATPLCTSAELQADACPAASKVGEVTAGVNVVVAVLPVPLTVTGDMFNLEPHPGEPARFGIVLRPPLSLPPPLPPLLPNTIIESGVELRKSDFGLDTVIKDIPNETAGLEVQIRSQEIHLFGTAGNPPQPFLRNPTSCGTKTTGFDATSYANPNTVVSGEATYELTGCENLPFAPAFSATIGAPGQTTPASKPPLSTVIGQTFEEAGLRRAEVILPPGVGADNAALVNQCSTADFEASACPENTIVGSARAESPVQATPLTGTVSIVEPLQPGLPNLGLDLQGALPLQLRGNFVLSPGPGNAFEGLPDIPISRFELAFDQGKLVSISRDLCAPPLPLFTVTFDGHNGAHVTDQVPATVIGCDGSKGKPTAKVKLRKTGSEHPSTRVKVTAGFSPVGDVKVKLPKQLRLAGGSDFDDGTKATADGDPLPDSVLGGRARKLTLDAGTGAAKLKVRVAGDALDRVKKIDRKVPFKIKVTDLAGERTKLKTKAG